MKHLGLILAVVIAFFTCHAQNVCIDSIPLPYQIGLNGTNYLGSRMALEGEKLYVPSSNGIYSIDLDNVEHGWTSHGFEGENLLECIHKGDEWLAITRNQNMRLLLRSTDNGKTVEDFTPYSMFPDNKYRNVLRLCQDSSNPEIIYLISGYVGILKSSDFGKTWNLISDEVNYNNTYCGFEIHPLNSDILLQHAENGAQAPTINISYDAGANWISSDGYPTPEITLPDEPDYSENCIHDIAFHPTDVNTWVYGGEGLIAKTTDRGMTWVDKRKSWGYHYSTIYDNKNPDIIYSLGVNARSDGRTGFILMVSSDGGDNWNDALLYIPNIPRYCNMKQTDNELLILNPEKLYVINKKDLPPLSSLQEINVNEHVSSDEFIYSIDGSVVGHKSDGDSMKKLPRGVYIYNRKKVLVR